MVGGFYFNRRCDRPITIHRLSWLSFSHLTLKASGVPKNRSGLLRPRMHIKPLENKAF